MPYYIRKKSANAWAHGLSEIILSSAYFRIYTKDSAEIFELTESAGSDNVLTPVLNITIVDETNGSIEYNETTGVALYDRLKTLGYPHFKTALGGSGAVDSVFGRTGVVVAQNGDYSLNHLIDVLVDSVTDGQVLRYNSVNSRFENYDYGSSSDEIKIGKFFFDTSDNTDTNAIEDDNMFRGLFSNDNYVVGLVLDAANFDEDDLSNGAVKLFTDNFNDNN